MNRTRNTNATTIKKMQEDPQDPLARQDPQRIIMEESKAEAVEENILQRQRQTPGAATWMMMHSRWAKRRGRLRVLPRTETPGGLCPRRDHRQVGRSDRLPGESIII
ncbi:hypothetical protein DPMN_134255 [Dreissena polymorpha]|uniref:Uncharacterized protein n=1 Tax=Dreissena polymorpha TaxID=45954 RepID=A0A9D4FVU5_DREPO|nr:hypothetical protein DPMN_134255 [Dreissena polymorpha]